jgi:AbrB family looped-hinge helix DNA binding protein
MEIIEMGTISSRGQIAIPSNIREHLGLKEGTKVVFAVSNNALIMKKVESMSWDEITKPLREEMKKSNLKESDVVDIIHRMRKKWKNEDST